VTKDELETTREEAHRQGEEGGSAGVVGDVLPVSAVARLQRSGARRLSMSGWQQVHKWLCLLGTTSGKQVQQMENVGPAACLGRRL
jgi:hypothetical protein